MGRGKPEGPPRVRDVMKEERRVAWRVSERKVKASLQGGVIKNQLMKDVVGYKNNQRQELRSLSQTSY